MHVTPWKQDVESCDRVGLIQAMPAGDSEKDRTGRQWDQRTELMRMRLSTTVIIQVSYFMNVETKVSAEST